jgi:hypothetical protein
MSTNYFDAADTDDEEEKCTIVYSPEDIADAQSQCAVVKGTHSFLGRIRHQKACVSHVLERYFYLLYFISSLYLN